MLSHTKGLDHSPPADVALLVLVISPSQIAEQLSNKRVVDQLTTLAPLFGLGKVVILINKLYGPLTNCLPLH
jgi:hypothetical protein